VPRVRAVGGGVAAAVTVTLAVPLLVGSWTLVAIAVAVPAAVGVSAPAAVIVAFVAVQVTF
jgi:hypothetical protein